MQTNRKARAVIAAGGTGGHLFPAGEVKKALLDRGFEVYLITDARGKKFARGFTNIRVITGGQWSGEGFWHRLKSLAKLSVGLAQSMYHMLKIQPKVAIGMGGYISVPVVLWAWMLRRRTVIHNADAVLGNANMLLARFADATCVSFENTKGIPKGVKPIVTGLPIREDIRKAADAPYASTREKISIAVMGGSQGAQIFSYAVPEAIAMLPPEIREKLSVRQQVVEEDVRAVETLYEKIGVKADIQSFFPDPAPILAGCSLFIGRAGASTVLEVGTIGRPAVFVPINHKDRQQFLNASQIAARGGAMIIQQSEFSAQSLARVLAHIFEIPNLLENMQKKSKIFDVSNDAAKRVADIAARTIPL
ncbi:MAG: UDP-N-acetylglucosamine--N-acetylmuramyl-(pentapeptide) pyrophosphoryl-undecaprenol N-acetylglucosamine transferase [Rickettsiales bacterium]|nr:UDP-N-acetylglucosamine--N-acetylmuramyl-(pentapeptide) pyrophosphoryl-undecaprenol N-acetylglucosamine transferase [Rickettsiales bacterium]